MHLGPFPANTYISTTFFILQVEKYHGKMKENAAPSSGKSGKRNETSNALAGLLEEDHISSGDSMVIDNAWRGAEVLLKQ